MLNLKVITASTRTGRKGPLVTAWLLKLAQGQKQFRVQHIDLATEALPFLDEPNMANLQDYQHAHTRRWSATIAEADAFVVVTPEYNNSYPAPLKNAIDYLFREWNYKPVAFVSYGGVSGGTRAVHDLKGVVCAVKMVPLKEAVHLPFFEKMISASGDLVPGEEAEKSAQALFSALAKWASALADMRRG